MQNRDSLKAKAKVREKREKREIFADLGFQNLTIAHGKCKAAFLTEKDFNEGYITVRDKWGNTAIISAETFIEMGGKGIEIQTEVCEI